MDTTLQDPVTVPDGKLPFAHWAWIPLMMGIGSLGLILLASFFPMMEVLAWPALAGFGSALLYFLVQCVARMLERRWRGALFAFLRLAGLAILAVAAGGLMLCHSFFGPSDDHFADHLAIPAGIDIAVPEKDASDIPESPPSTEIDAMQAAIRAALAVPGGDDPAFTPRMPSLRRAATDQPQAFRDYVEASPDWHVFIERGNRFAARRWSYEGEPRDTLHGYISEFGGDGGFQTRCLLCLDRKQWSRYSVQHVQEGSIAVTPDTTVGNSLKESRVMIECGSVWVEIFEQSAKLERRITKATVTALENEFAAFEKNPAAAVLQTRERSRELARRLAGDDGQPFRLLEGMQPGIYGVAYSLNPGEPGVVYLKAFEVTQGTPLSASRLRGKSETRMTWSENPAERFGAKAGFTVYEGDWGKPYAARFEVWFKPDSGKVERKLAERVFKIEGWQR